MSYNLLHCKNVLDSIRQENPKYDDMHIIEEYDCRCHEDLKKSQKDKHVIEFRQIEEHFKLIPEPYLGRGTIRNSDTSDIYHQNKDIYESAKEFMETYYYNEKEHVGIREILHEFEKAECDVDYEGFTNYNDLETDTYFHEREEYNEND